mmetsp:Transcript_91336/g.295359  ORF Transcript_91336/g.295359 Transcript_91336/m.295359 type:complete len:229 (-) Transcript_91336:347-1033(-)
MDSRCRASMEMASSWERSPRPGSSMAISNMFSQFLPVTQRVPVCLLKAMPLATWLPRSSSWVTASKSCKWKAPVHLAVLGSNTRTTRVSMTLPSKAGPCPRKSSTNSNSLSPGTVCPRHVAGSADTRLKFSGSRDKMNSELFVARKDLRPGPCVKPQPSYGNECDFTKLKFSSYSNATWSSYVDANQRPPNSAMPSMNMGLARPSVIFCTVTPVSLSTTRTNEPVPNG